MPSQPSEPTAVPAQDRQIERAEGEITRTREQVWRAALALRRALTKRTEWRDWVRRKPRLFLAVAFGVGFALARRASQPPH